MSDTVVIVPILKRAHRVAPVAQSIRDTCDARVLFACTPGDDEVIRAVEELPDVADYITVAWYEVGDYARKINTGVKVTGEPLIFMGADDLEFQPGWLEAAKARVAPGVGVIGTNDLGNPRVLRGEHATHSLVTREYIDTYGATADGQPGMALHEGYRHEFCDDELVGVAKRRNAWVFAGDSHVKHLHPHWCPEVPTDEMYEGQGQRLNEGRRLFAHRQLLWTA